MPRGTTSKDNDAPASLHLNTAQVASTPIAAPGKKAGSEDTTGSRSDVPNTDAGATGTRATPQDDASSSESRRGQAGSSQGAEPLAAIKTPSAPATNNSPADVIQNPLAAHAPTTSAIHPSAGPAPAEPPQASSSQTLAAWQNYESSTGKIVTSARMAELASGGEMHVELRSSPLGPVEVHAVVREGSVGADIHVEGREAHTLLAANLPSLERALGQRDLSVGTLAVYQDHAGGGMSGGNRESQHWTSTPHGDGAARQADTPPRPRNQAEPVYEVASGVNLYGGLSVHA
jgi:flagellar hook-length control protein FliK